MTEQHKRGALLRYLCILFAGAILIIALSLAVRRTQAAEAGPAETQSAYSENIHE